VFGSYARDGVSPWSDIDVLVVRDAPADSRSIDMVDDLYRSGGLGGDIVTVASAHYPRGLEAMPFGKTILAEGVAAWFAAADSDMHVAVVVRDTAAHIACFHAQQSAEKALKALVTRLSGTRRRCPR